MSRRLIAALAAALVFSLPVSLPAEEPIGVDVVVEWLQKGVKEYWIIRQIKKKDAVFHLSTADMKRLKEEGAGPDLLQAMIETAGPKPAVAEPKVEPTPPDPTPVPPNPPDPVPPIATPKNSTPEATDPVPPVAATDLVRYRHPWGAFELDYPHGWRVTTIRGGKHALSAKHFDVGFVPDGESDDLDLSERYFEVHFVRKFWDDKPPTLESWEERYREAAKKQGIIVSPGKRSQVDGRAALTMMVTRATEDGKGAFQLILYMVIQPEGMYSIAFGATSEKRVAAAIPLTKIFDSFKWGKFDEDGPGNTPIDKTLPSDAEEGKAFIGWAEKDGRFRLQYPSPWNVTARAYADPGDPSAPWQAYYFSRSKYDPASGAPFSFGVSVMVRRTTDPTLPKPERLDAFADEIAARFTDQQQKRGTLARVLGSDWVTFAGIPARRINYSLLYSSEQEEVGYLIVTATPHATFVVEANTPKSDFNRYQKVLLRILMSFEILGPQVVAVPAAAGGTEEPEIAEVIQADPAEAFTKWRNAMAHRDVEVLWELRSQRLKDDMNRKAETARRMVKNASPSEREQLLSDLGLPSERIDSIGGKEFFHHYVERRYPAEIVGAVASLTVKGKEVAQDHATLTVLRKDMGTGRVSLVFEEGAWRIDTDF